MTTSTLDLACPPRFGTSRTNRPTLGPAVGEVAALLGKPFMPWQQHVADVVLEIDPDTGRLAYSEYRVTVPRQAGKSTWLLAKALHRASATQFFGPRQQIVYAAQTRKDSRKKWEEDFLGLVQASKAFKSRVSPSLANGNEYMRFPNGSRFGIESTTEKSGHGATLDEGVVDEAFAQLDGRVEQAFRPAMITRPNAQLGVVSTAGWLDASPYLHAKVTHGRQLVADGVTTGVAYFEWSAPQDADPFDRDVWRDCMPALGYIREDGSGITEAKIAAELEAILGSPEGLNGFRRAYLNQWVQKTAPAEAVINLDMWALLADTSAEPAPHTGQITLAIDTDPNRERTSICSAGDRAGGPPMVELVENLPGVDWAVEHVIDLARRNHARTVVIDKRSAAARLVKPLTDARIRVTTADSAQMTQACGLLYDTVVETSGLAHLGQVEMTDALRNATTRPLADAWAWDRKNTAADITPLTAATLAFWGHVNNAGRPANAGRGRAIALG